MTFRFPQTVGMLLLAATSIGPANVHAVEWIWSARPRGKAQTVYLRKEFEVPSEVRTAELSGVADFSWLTVWLNGQRIAGVEYGDAAFRRDVSRLVTQGPNVLAAHAVSADGPAAVALRLELALADGTRQSVVTDLSWRTANAPAAHWRQLQFTPGEEWTAARSFGRVASVMWSDPETDTGIREVDDYTQWKRALETDGTSDPSTFFVPDGFEIERLRSARENEGSWVSLEFDPQGRLIVAREDKGLLRMTLPDDLGEMQVETINDTLEECRGLLCAHGCLYVNANNSKGLYRLRDTDGDDRYDETTLLYESGGGVGHGRNDLALGPDGRIYAIHGDAVDLPNGFADRTSPFREHRRGRQTHEGHLLRFDADGGNGEIIAAGLRNPYGIDFHPDGEPFTYDADAEFDMGAPWYRPTRIDHLVSGADFGWRGVTGSWPPHYPDHPDNAAPTLDIGKGSPTGVKFGTRSKFPDRYRRALFVLDWAYGRILAVHLTPRGSSYAARATTFIKGRPLNVTDLGFGPDGAMYVVTGGRKTQAALYRIRYVGPAVAQRPPTQQQIARADFSVGQRTVRRRLEAFHGYENPEALATAWPYLDSPDRSIRHAARMAVEHQPVETWQERALNESRPLAAVTALVALARSEQPELRPRIVTRLNELPLAEFTTTAKLAALYAYRLCLTEPESIDAAAREAVARHLKPLYTGESPAIDQELSRLLIALDAPAAVPKTLELLRAATDQQERLHYLFVLRTARSGWTPELRRRYFLSLAQMQEFRGGEGMPGFIRRIEADALAALEEKERKDYEPLLAPSAVAPQTTPSESRPIVREWKLDDLMDALPAVGAGRDFDRGEKLFSGALCVRCHRVGHLGAAVGPDLTALGNRFSRRDILKSILDPSDVVAEQYRRTQLVTTDGRVLVGQILPGRDYRSPTLVIAADPLKPDSAVEVPKSDIEQHTTSPVSVMPTKLLDTLTRDEILELLAWLEAGGDRGHPNFRR